MKRFASVFAAASASAVPALADARNIVLVHVATQDLVLNPDFERSMYERSGAKVTEIEASHALYISKAAEVAKVIEEAAQAAK